MGILGKLFGRDSGESGGATATAPQEELSTECPHTTLLGRWDAVDDMGKPEKATMWVCDACQTEFSPEEGERLREPGRLRMDQ